MVILLIQQRWVIIQLREVVLLRVVEHNKQIQIPVGLEHQLARPVQTSLRIEDKRRAVLEEKEIRIGA